VSSSATETPLVRAESPLRKQTLLGVAPPTVAAPSQPATPQPPLETPGATADTSAAVSSSSLPLAVASDAPTTLDLRKSEPRLALDGATSTPAATAAAVAQAEPAARLPDGSAASGAEDELKPRSRGPWLGVAVGLAAAAAIALVALPRLGRAPAPEPARKLAAEPQAAPPAALAPPAEPRPKTDEGDEPKTPEPLPPDPDPLQAKAEAPASSAAPAASAASGEVIRIQVESDPPGARLFWKGKPVGTTPFTLEYAPGEKHAYEMGMPGFLTRKVVVDGSKPKVSIGLKPDPAAATGAKRRK
jgi:hypothetical protein